MPRKVSYGPDYDDDDAYDDYDDYGYDYDYDEQESIEATQTKQEPLKKVGVWKCSICTYDNEDDTNACEICGVLRNPLVKSGSGINGSSDTVNDMCKDSGVSIMAKSLFTSLPHSAPSKAVTFQHQHGETMNEESNSLQKNRIMPSNLLYKDFLSQKQRFDIAPFKFDVPSPDELVSKGLLKSFKIPSTVKVNKSSSDVPSKPGKDKSTVLPSKSATKVHVSSEEDAVSSKDGGKPQSLPNGLNSLNLNAKPGSSKNVHTRGTASQAKYKPEKWMLPDQAEDGLTQLNLAIVGHVDSGKSTLSGRLLHLLGQITQKEMHKYEKEAKSMGKGSFAYAWALDESAEERERGITMTVAVAYFDTNKYHVVVLDSPGHRDFVPNMITGATQADAAILVIDASVGAFEAGIDSFGGQTKEHAHLIRSFGVDQIIVAINKMDVVNYSIDRFDAIKQQVATFLRSCGFKDSFMTWVPLSAMENQNLIAPPNDPQLLSWYKGPYLLEAIDSLQPPIRDYSKPVLMPICDVVRLQSAGQVSAGGKLETGALRSGSKVLVLPSGDIATVRSLERNSQSCSIARAGDNVFISLQGFDVNQVMAGGVLCHPDFPVAVSNYLEIKILVLDMATPILVGSQLEFHIHHVKEVARVAKISSLLDPKTGNVKKVMPRCLTAKQSAIIEVVLEESVCVEEFSKCKALGRAFLRSMGRTIAVGIVTKILDQPEI